MLASRVPAIVFERRREPGSWRWLVLSVLVHVAVITAAVVDWRSAEIPTVDMRTPGGPGPVGGGGGGGGPRVTYVTLPAYQPPARATERERAETRPEDLVIPTPTVVEVEIVQPEFEIPQTVTDAGAPILGRGPGIGGGPGAGTGTGGGIGSGRGTGVGSGTGPGSGGEGGEIFPPAPRYTILPPHPRPKSVQGKNFYAKFRISPDGRVLNVEVVPEIRDGDYRRRLIAQLYEWTFAPAYTREGVLVQGEVVVTLTL